MKNYRVSSIILTDSFHRSYIPTISLTVQSHH